MGVEFSGRVAERARLSAAAARTARTMERSLAVPTATSVREVPAAMLLENRRLVIEALPGPVSVTHLIGYAVVRALADVPEMNTAYLEDRGSPAVLRPAGVNLGVLVDAVGPGGQRRIRTPSVKRADSLDFRAFHAEYAGLVESARTGRLGVTDMLGATISITNPGTMGTGHSVPRLMAGQGAIIGVGAVEYPAAFRGCGDAVLIGLAIGKVLTLTSTYDHRVIQGASSAEYLRRVQDLLLGADGFYEKILASLDYPWPPYQWGRDETVPEQERAARVRALIAAYRTLRPGATVDIAAHGLTVWDLDREFSVDGSPGRPSLPAGKTMKLREIIAEFRRA